MDFKSEEFGRFFSAISLAMFFFIIVLISLKIFNFKSNDPLSNALSYGCYTADSAPPILLDEDGLTIVQDDLLRFDYQLIQIKSAYLLEIYGPIGTFWDGHRFHFSAPDSGSGRFAPFYVIENRKLNYDYDPTSLDNFHLSAQSKNGLNYMRMSYLKTEDSDCVIP